MEDLISVVIPIYKVEPYLERCVKSVLGQTYRNLEVILVDDGSPDRCGAMCDRYQTEDSRVKVIHKENGGLSDARNAGIDIAKGRYITFIDSDDYVKETYVEYLYGLIKEFGTRMSIALHEAVYETGRVISWDTKERISMKAEDCMERILYHDVLDISAWGKLYELSLFENVRYPKGKLFEDAGTTYKLIVQCDKIACGFESQYYYMIRSNSIVTGAFHMNKLHMIEMTDQMAETLRKKYPALEDAIQRRQVYARFTTLRQLTESAVRYREKEKEMVSYIKKHASSVLKNKKAPSRDKFAVATAYLGAGFFKHSWKLYCRMTGRK